MWAVIFCRPLFLAAQLENPHSGRGCPQQVSKVNSHIWRGAGGGQSVSTLLGTYQVLEVIRGLDPSCMG